MVTPQELLVPFFHPIGFLPMPASTMLEDSIRNKYFVWIQNNKEQPSFIFDLDAYRLKYVEINFFKKGFVYCSLSITPFYVFGRCEDLVKFYCRNIKSCKRYCRIYNRSGPPLNIWLAINVFFQLQV